MITDHRSEAYRNEVLQSRVTVRFVDELSFVETRAVTVTVPCYEVANEVLQCRLG